MISAIILSPGIIFFTRKSVLISIVDSKSNFFSFLGEVFENILLLAGLHGKGDKSNELVLLEYDSEEIRQQVNFATTDKISNDSSTLNPFHFSFFCRFTSNALRGRNFL